MINNTTTVPPIRVAVEHTEIWTPVEGQSYAHHASLCAFKGALYAVWSNGHVNEDDCGQRVMLSRLNEDGNWSPARVLADPKTSAKKESVFTAAGLYTYEDMLVAYVGAFEYNAAAMEGDELRPSEDTHHENTRLGYMTTTDGINWTDISWLPLKMVPNHGPRPIRSGRLIISGSTSFPYTDDVTGLGGYTMTGIYGDAFGNETVVDDSGSILPVAQANDWPCLLCEGAFFQTDDDVLHMLLRTRTGVLWETQSCDDGITWSAPFPTEMKSDNSKFDFGRLPDGRYFFVGNSVPRSGRNPMMLCLSENGVDFDKHILIADEPYEKQFEGLFKMGLYAYPHALVWKDRLFVIYSKRKEAIEVASVRLSDI